MNHHSLDDELKALLRAQGAAVAGFADLTELPEEVRDGYPRGVSIGLPWDKDILRKITDGPTPEYKQNYDALNDRLDEIVTYAADWLCKRGYRALARTRAVAGYNYDDHSTKLPHKTLATRAGIGWIGKCALMITPEYGAGLRISSLLTDAPIKTAEPVNESRCGDCGVCREICPGRAVSGKLWSAGMPREEFFNARACFETARVRSMKNLGIEITLCGLCILRCPWTQRYLDK